MASPTAMSTPKAKSTKEEENADESLLAKIMNYFTPSKKKSNSVEDDAPISPVVNESKNESPLNEDQTPIKVESSGESKDKMSESLTENDVDGKVKKLPKKGQVVNSFDKIEVLSSNVDAGQLEKVIKESQENSSEVTEENSEISGNGADSDQQDVLKENDLREVKLHGNLDQGVEVAFDQPKIGSSNPNTEVNPNDPSGSVVVDKGKEEKEKSSNLAKKSRRMTELDRLSMTSSKKDCSTEYIMDHPTLSGFRERTDDPFYVTHMTKNHAKRSFLEKPTKRLNEDERSHWATKKLEELKHSLNDFEGELCSIQRLINDQRLVNLRSKMKIAKRFAQEMVRLTHQIKYLDEDFIPAHLYVRMKKSEENWKKITRSVPDYYVSSSGRSSVTSEAGSWNARESLFGDFVIPENISEISCESNTSTVTHTTKDDYQDLLRRHECLQESHREVINQITQLKKREQDLETTRKLKDAEASVKSYQMLISETAGALGSSRPDREPEKPRTSASTLSATRNSHLETRDSALSRVQGRVNEAVNILDNLVPGQNTEVTETEVRTLRNTLQKLKLSTNQQSVHADVEPQPMEGIFEEELGEAASVRVSAAGCSTHSTLLETRNRGSRSGRAFVDYEEDDDAQIHHFSSDSGRSWENLYQQFKQRLDKEEGNTMKKILARSILPKHDLPKFSGDPIRFPMWYQAFNHVVGDQAVSPSEKMIYLSTHLSGLAYQSVESYFLLNTNEAYDQAMKLLKSRFGKPECIEDEVYKRLDAWQEIGDRDLASLLRYSDFLTSIQHARSDYDLSFLDQRHFIQHVAVRLPLRIASNWSNFQLEREENGKKVTFKELQEFVEKAAKVSNSDLMQKKLKKKPYSATNAVSSFPVGSPSVTGWSNEELSLQESSRLKTPKSPPKKKKLKKDKVQDGQILMTGSEENPLEDVKDEKKTLIDDVNKVTSCRLCKRRHYTRKCRTFRSYDEKKTKEFCDKIKYCHMCVTPLHPESKCYKMPHCDICLNPHTVWSCPVELVFPNNESSKDENSSTQPISSGYVGQSVGSLARVIPVYLYSRKKPEKKIKTLVFLDEGSDKTFCTESLLSRLEMEKTRQTLKLRTVNGDQDNETWKISNLEVQSMDGKVRIPLDEVFSSKTLDLGVDSVPTKERVCLLKDLAGYTEKFPSQKDIEGLQPEILIGRNVPEALIPVSIPPQKSVPFIIESKLGWGVIGEVKTSDISPEVFPEEYLSNLTQLIYAESMERKKAWQTLWGDVKFMTACYNISKAKANERFILDSRFLKNFSTLKSAVRGLSALLRRVQAQKGISKTMLENRKSVMNLLIRSAQQEFIKNSKDAESIVSELQVISINGFLRVKGRTKHSSCKKEDFPLFMPKTSKMTELVVQDCHEKCQHQGRIMTSNYVIQEGYYVVNLRGITARIIRQCVICAKTRHGPMGQMMADLPNERIKPSSPFSNVGVDVFGPYHVKDGRKYSKRYGLMCTCLSTRAVHIELLDDLTTGSFISALRNIIAIRGNLTTIFCDLGTNFVGASRTLRGNLRDINMRELEAFCAMKNVEFRFIPGSASHMGGSWERAIGSARRVLNGMFSTQKEHLSSTSLRTFFSEAAAIINSRPYSDASVESGDIERPLTPNHLLTLKHCPIWPPPGFDTVEEPASEPSQQWKLVQSYVNRFWERWKSEYLQSLQRRKKWKKKKPNIQKDDVVLIQGQEKTPRNTWKIGQVLEAKPAEDGLIRHVKLRQAPVCNCRMKRVHESEVLTRPIHKLIFLFRPTINNGDVT